MSIPTEVGAVRPAAHELVEPSEVAAVWEVASNLPEA